MTSLPPQFQLLSGPENELLVVIGSILATQRKSFLAVIDLRIGRQTGLPQLPSGHLNPLSFRFDLRVPGEVQLPGLLQRQDGLLLRRAHTNYKL